MGRSPCCDRAAVKRGPWSPEEDDALRAYIQRHGTRGSWISLPKKAGLRRCGKSCRLRWLNYLRPDIRHGGFTDEEDAMIISLYSTLGSRWSLIASHLERRTDNDVKNYWNTKLKKRLSAAAAAASSIPSTPCLPLPAPAPAPALEPVPTHPSLIPLAIPTVKTEMYTCDDFLVPTELQDPFAGCADADGSTSASAGSSASNLSADNGAADGDGLFPDFCMGSDLGGAAAAEDQFLGGYYYPLDPSSSPGAKPNRGPWVPGHPPHFQNFLRIGKIRPYRHPAWPKTRHPHQAGSPTSPLCTPHPFALASPLLVTGLVSMFN